MNEEYGIFWGDSLYQCSSTKVALIENFLYENDVICISSRPGVGKSILAKQLMFNLTTANSFLDTYTIAKPCNVLYIQSEGDRIETIERIGNMKKGLVIDDKRWVHINVSGTVINTDRGINNLICMAKRPHMMFDVIIIDPLYTTVKGRMTDDSVATEWIRNARRLKGVFNSSMIILHHDHKDMYYEGKTVERAKDNIYGATFWGAFFNHNFKLRKHKGIHYLESGKQRSGKIVDSIEMKLIEPSPLMYASNDELLDLSTVKVSKVLRNADGRLAIAKIVEAIDMNRATAYRALAKLQDNGRVVKEIDEGHVYYKWKDSIAEMK